MEKRLALLILATVAPACDDGDGGGSDAALVGHWELHDDETGELESTLVFDQDGTYRYEELGEGAESNQGTFEAGDGLLSLDGTDDEGAHVIAALTYFADDEQLMYGALLPDGDVDGPVGRWSGSLHLETDGEVVLDSEDSYQLSADGTATVSSRSGSDSRTIDDATWAEEEGEIVITFDYQGITVHLHMVLIDGAALGNPIYTRAD